MTNVKDLFKILRDYNVTYTDGEGLLNHWTIEVEDRKLRQRILRDIFICLGHNEVRYKYYFVEKNKNTFCSDPKCVHPDCHKISLRKSKGKENVMVDNMTVEDIIEIAEEIDIEEFYNLGAKVYLKTFNETQPDFLKINEKQLLAAVKHVESKND